MDKCTKIVIGYILAIVLYTVLILSIIVQLSKNVREDYTSYAHERKARERRYFWFFCGLPIIILAIIHLFNGLFFLGSKLPFGCTDCYKDWAVYI